MIRRKLTGALGALAAVLTLAGCGTATFDNEFAVTVADPSGRLGTDQVQVSVFDNTMGDTQDWAEKDLGIAAPGAPYRASVFATATKMIGDSSPPTDVRAGLYLPQFDDTGYYAIQLQPVAGETVTVAAPYVTYDYSWETSGKKRPTKDPLPLTITAGQGDKGWQLAVEVQIPPAP